MNPATRAGSATSSDSVTGAGAPDRPALIRQALRQLVAERGFHGASMSAIAKQAGVAAGTAYVHYESKDDVVLAAYHEARELMTLAALHELDLGADVGMNDRFRQMWMNIYDFLVANPDVAHFLLQVEASPYSAQVHPGNDVDEAHPLVAALGAVKSDFVDLPAMFVFDLGLGPAIRAAASDESLDPGALARLADSCWRAIYPH